jgi:hypothetical protein
VLTKDRVIVNRRNVKDHRPLCSAFVLVTANRLRCYARQRAVQEEESFNEENKLFVIKVDKIM